MKLSGKLAMGQWTSD